MTAKGIAAVLVAVMSLVMVLTSGAGATETTDIWGPKSPIAPTDPSAVPTDTNEALIFLKPGTDAAQFAKDYGLTLSATLESSSDAHVFSAASVDAARSAVSQALADPRVSSAYVNQQTVYTSMSFVPNDPYFHKNTPTSGWPGQWHLINEWTAGLDAGVQGAWNRDVTGLGVHVAIVDDSMQINHPDLAPNYDAADSWDFGQNDGDPSPVNSNDNHGTSVAGVLAARGGNGIGVTGVAPFATVSCERIDFPTQTTQMFVNATLYHSSGANTTIKVKNHSYGISTPYIRSTPEVAALDNSTSAGTIHCFATGNDRGSRGQDANKKDLQHDPSAIAVAAVGSDGKWASYSDFGACVFVTAPSNSATGFTGITTTDRTGSAGYNPSGDTFPNDNYTSTFGGTSSASPTVAGVMALGVQVQPNLNTRFAKHLLALTSTVVDASDSTYESDGGWKTNAAGYHFNQNYGFGLINADQFTQKAVQYSGVTALQTENISTTTVNATIPDANLTGISRNFSLTSHGHLEEMLVTLSITHPYRGDVEAFLYSPAGTESRLMVNSASDSSANINWTFSTNMFWGENATGQWTLQVRDVAALDVGTWNNYSITARMGDLVGVPEPATLALLALGGLAVIGRRLRRKG